MRVTVKGNISIIAGRILAPSQDGGFILGIRTCITLVLLYTRVFFPVYWNGAGFTLNQHFIQTFVNYYPSSDLVFWNLCIVHSTFVRKVFTIAVYNKLGIYGPFWEKRYYLALGLGPYNGPKFTGKIPVHYFTATLSGVILVETLYNQSHHGVFLKQKMCACDTSLPYIW